MYNFEQALEYFKQNGIEWEDTFDEMYDYVEGLLSYDFDNEEDETFTKETLDKLLEKAKEKQEEIKAREAMYDYDEAVDYLEEHGVGCDPCSDIEGEYVCDLLDEYYDDIVDDYETYYEESTLKWIIEMAQEYIEDMDEDEED